MHAIATKAFQLCAGCSCAAVLLHTGYFSQIELFVSAAALAITWPLVTHGCDYVPEPSIAGIDEAQRLTAVEDMANVIQIHTAGSDEDKDRAA